MKKLSWTISKFMVISITLILLNITVLPSYQHALAADLTNESLRPELYRYWEYRNSDLKADWVFLYVLEVKEEKIIKIANQDVPILVLEGQGSIEKWPEDVTTGSSTFYIKEEIISNNLELVTYSQKINYSSPEIRRILEHKISCSTHKAQRGEQNFVV